MSSVKKKFQDEGLMCDWILLRLEREKSDLKSLDIFVIFNSNMLKLDTQLPTLTTKTP